MITGVPDSIIQDLIAMLAFSKAMQGYFLDKKLQLSKETVRNYSYVLKRFCNWIEGTEAIMEKNSRTSNHLAI